MKKKIGLLIPSLNSGGAERAVSRLSKILSDRYEVYIIVYDTNNIIYTYEGQLINLDVETSGSSLTAKILLAVRRSFKLKKIKEKYKLNVVISFMDSPNIVNLMSTRNTCQTIISMRNYILEYEKSPVNLITKALYKKADAVISVSKLLAEKMIDQYKISDEKSYAIYNPYDIKEIHKKKNMEINKEYINFFNTGFIFSSVGRITYQKGFWHLIKAFKLVNDKYEDTKLVIIGRDELDGAAQRLVEKLGIKDKVLFTGFQENPYQFINASNVYVLSSLYEGFPNALVEAMTCGVPVIASDCLSGPKEILCHNNIRTRVLSNFLEADYGIIVPALEEKENWNHQEISENDRILARAMLRLFEDRKLFNILKEKSKIRASDFNYENCKESYEHVIEAVISKNIK